MYTKRCNLLALMLMASLVAAASSCSDGSPASTALTNTAAASSGAGSVSSDGWSVCTNRTEGFAVAYPDQLHTTDVMFGEPMEPSYVCAYFDREPFDPKLGAEPDGEGLTYAVQIYTQANDVETIVSTPGTHVVDRERLVIAGQPATRLETVLKGERLGEPVGGYYRYLIDTPDGGQLTIMTAEHVDPAAYEGNKHLVDQVAATVRFV